MKKEAIIIFLAAVLLVISGVEQCPQTGIGGTGGSSGGKTEAASYGVDFKLVEGFDKLTAGKTITLGETFYVDILLENYGSGQKSGQICIDSDLNAAYNGIYDSCQQFTIPGATYIGGKLDTPASIKISFPGNDYYTPYSGLPSDIDSTFYITISYTQHSVASGAVKSPTPEIETLTLTQEASPVKMSAEKFLSSRDKDINVNLKFGLQKQGSYNITTMDFKRNAVAFSAQLGFYNLNCPDLKQGIIDFENTKFISCSALLPREPTTEFLTLTLDYGVKLTKQFSFKIQKTA